MSMADPVRLAALAPKVLREDESGRGLLAALQDALRTLSDDLPIAAMSRDVDAMGEAMLDEMAWERYVTWYDDTADLETKRGLIRDALKIHAKMGTPWAVERVVREYFGEGDVLEWWEYGGEPYHFCVTFSTLEVTEARLQFLRRIVERVKNVRSVMDGIFIFYDAAFTGWYGAAVDEGEILYLEEVDDGV